MNEELFVIFKLGRISSFDILSISYIVNRSEVPSWYPNEVLAALLYPELPPGIKLVILTPNFSLISLSLILNYSFKCAI